MFLFSDIGSKIKEKENLIKCDQAKGVKLGFSVSLKLASRLSNLA
jgi:hypothetical protein